MAIPCCWWLNKGVESPATLDGSVVFIGCIMTASGKMQSLCCKTRLKFIETDHE